MKNFSKVLGLTGAFALFLGSVAFISLSAKDYQVNDMDIMVEEANVEMLEEAVGVWCLYHSEKWVTCGPTNPAAIN